MYTLNTWRTLTNSLMGLASLKVIAAASHQVRNGILSATLEVLNGLENCLILLPVLLNLILGAGSRLGRAVVRNAVPIRKCVSLAK